MSHIEPTIGDPDGLIPLMPFGKTMGVNMPTFTAPDVWENVVRHSPYDAMASLAKAITCALNEVGSDRADRANIDFKYWIPLDGGKSRRVRLRAEARLSEEKGPWILLKLSPVQSLPGVSAA